MSSHWTITVRRSFGLGRTTVKTSNVPTADDALRLSLILASRGIGEVTVR